MRPHWIATTGLLLGIGFAPWAEAGAAVALQIDYTSGVSSKEAGDMMIALEAAIAERSGRRVVADSGKPCGRTPDCVSSVFKRTGAKDIVFIKLIGVPTRIRFLAERFKRGGEPKKFALDLSRNPPPGKARWAQIAEELFPEPPVAKKITKKITEIEPPPPPGEVDVTPPPIEDPKPSKVSWAPWVLMGVGVALGGAGIGFGLSSRAARRSAANEPHTDLELAELEDRAVGHGLAANILWGTAGASAIAGGIFWIISD